MVLKLERTQRIFRKIDACDDFLHLRKDPEIAQLLLTRYTTIKNLWEDSQRMKMRGISAMELLVDFLEKRGRPKEYTVET